MARVASGTSRVRQASRSIGRPLVVHQTPIGRRADGVADQRAEGVKDNGSCGLHVYMYLPIPTYLLEQLALELDACHHERLAAGPALRRLVVADDLYVGIVVDHCHVGRV